MNRARSCRPAESRLSSQSGRAGGGCLGRSEYFNWSWPFTLFVFECTQSNIRKIRMKQMGATLENTVHSDFQCAPQRMSVFLSWAPVVSDHGDIKSIFLLGRAPHLDKVMNFWIKVQHNFEFCIQIWQIKTFFVYYSWMRHSQIHLHSTYYTVNSMHSACLNVYINGGPNISCLLFLCFTCFCHNYVWDAIYACHACTYWNWR